LSLLDGGRPACGRQLSTESIPTRRSSYLELDPADLPLTLSLGPGRVYVIRETAAGGVVMNRATRKKRLTVRRGSGTVRP